MTRRPTPIRDPDELLEAFAELSGRSVPPARTHPARGRSALGALATGMAAVVIVALVGGLVASRMLPQAATPATPSPATPSPTVIPEPAVAEDISGPFRLVFEMPSATWREDEPITGQARLELLEGESAVLSGSGTGVLGYFHYEEITGRRSMEAIWSGDCAGPYEMGAESPITSGLRTSGGWSVSDPDADFYREFAEGPDVRLPVGEWDITAIATFNVGLDCEPPGILLRATIRVTILPSAAPPDSTRGMPLPAADPIGDGCASVALDGQLAGHTADPRLAWIERADGSAERIDVVWPPGYSARFAPGLEVLDADGRVVLREGGRVDAGCAWNGLVLLLPPFPEPTPVGSPAPSPISPGAPSARQVEVASRPVTGPIRATVGGSAVWTGQEVIVWGGHVDDDPAGFGAGRPTNVGAAYDPAADEWRPVAASPLEPRMNHFAVWTGAEMLIWGGADGALLRADGAAYDPQHDTWRLLSEAPPAWVDELARMTDQGGAESASVWTGERWVLAYKGFGDDTSDPIHVVTYDPQQNSWTQVPTVRGPRGDDIDLGWTGDELILMSVGMQWRLAPDDTDWRPIAPALHGLTASLPVWTGDRLIALITEWRAASAPWSYLATWDPATDSWTELPQPPVSAYGSMLLWDGRHAVPFGSNLGYDFAEGVWLEAPMGVERLDTVTAWTGSQLFVWGGWDCDMCAGGIYQEGLLLTPEW
jgi:hypothetical protein